MKYDVISFKFSRELTEQEERIFHQYFKDMYVKLKRAIELFADPERKSHNVGLNNIIVKKMMELNKKMPNGMDMSFLVEAKCKAILFHYDDYMRLDHDDNDKTVYHFMLDRDAFNMNKTGVGYIDNEYLNLFHRSQSQIVNDIRRLALPKMHMKPSDCIVKYDILEVPDTA